MNIENKVKVTKVNKALLESILGEKIRVNEVIYLQKEEMKYYLQELRPETLDLLDYLYQDAPNMVLIWDERNGLNISANLYAISEETLEEIEPDLERIVIGNYGECN